MVRSGRFGHEPYRLAGFGLLGGGFLLLQTKSIVDCALYFGSTWLVSMLVVAGVLLMVMAANLVAIRLERFRAAYFVPLLASLVLLVVVPPDLILRLPVAGRLVWVLLAMPLPIFFAGLVFSTLFREHPSPPTAFGANLVGATVGGFCEYLGLIVGYRGLSLLVVVAYLAAYLLRPGPAAPGGADEGEAPPPTPDPAR